MKHLFLRILSTFLCIALLASGGVLCFADASQKPYRSYVCLGDSISAGYSDITHGPMWINTPGVEGSFHSIIADRLADQFIVYAMTGATTDDIRYMLEENYPFEKTRYAYMVDPAILPDIRSAVAGADLITVNAGANDLLIAPLHKFLEYMEAGDFFVSIQTGMIREDLESGKLNDALKGILKSLADVNKLKTLLPTLASYLLTGIRSYYDNWPYIISDIKSLNQKDADLVVLGVYNPLASYDDMEGDDGIKAALAYLCDTLTPLVDLINLNLRIGARQYGYTYVSIVGIDVEEVHPSAEGHREIAERILSVLPDAAPSQPFCHPILKKLSRIFNRKAS